MIRLAKIVVLNSKTQNPKFKELYDSLILILNKHKSAFVRKSFQDIILERKNQEKAPKEDKGSISSLEVERLVDEKIQSVINKDHNICATCRLGKEIKLNFHHSNTEYLGDNEAIIELRFQSDDLELLNNFGNSLVLRHVLSPKDERNNKKYKEKNLDDWVLDYSDTAMVLDFDDKEISINYYN